MASASTVDRSRWVCIYPVYINKKKTLAEGRRIPKEAAVDDPNLLAMAKSLHSMGFQFLPEPHKAYSRDIFERGRIKVQLKKDDGSPVYTHVPNRNTLLLKLAQMVPRFTEGTEKPQDPMQAALAAAAAATNNAPGSSGGGGGEKEKKKGGKKKK